LSEATLVISFYNNISYLRLIFAGLERQSVKNFDVIISDDGFKSEIVEEIKNFSGTFSFPIKHIWQEDKGFRKNRMLNRAIQEASCDFLIFIDGDCVPHSKFIEEHIKARSERFINTGRRVNLSQKVTSRLSEAEIREGYLEKYTPLLFDGIFGKSYDVEKGFYFSSPFLRSHFNKKKRGLLGCNMSMTKQALLAVNGFDERYEAPAIGEDSDIQFRLELAGYNMRSLNNIAVQYHLYHRIQPRQQRNNDLFEQVQKEKKAFTPFGINKGELSES